MGNDTLYFLSKNKLICLMFGGRYLTFLRFCFRCNLFYSQDIHLPGCMEYFFILATNIYNLHGQREYIHCFIKLGLSTETVESFQHIIPIAKFHNWYIPGFTRDYINTESIEHVKDRLICTDEFIDNFSNIHFRRKSIPNV